MKKTRTKHSPEFKAKVALAAVQASDIAHAHALYVGAALANSQGDCAEAGRMLEKCLALRRGIATFILCRLAILRRTAARLPSTASIRRTLVFCNLRRYSNQVFGRY